jgi:3-dehydroquinate synthase
VKIEYKIDKQIHQVIIKRDDICKDLIKDLKFYKSDNRLLLVYDKRISKDLVNDKKKKLKIHGIKYYSIGIYGGKVNKDKKFLFKILSILSKLEFTKKSVLISFGGGVVGDVVGLAASLYMRGLIYFHIPSTMMAIMDSCIGGKTAINFNNRINLIGNYYHPKRVYISNQIIKKIPQKEYLSGFAEAIKCGIIDDHKILDILKVNSDLLLKKNFKILSNILYRVLKVKINYFINDVYETNNRLILNFGHTFAHAIESALMDEKINFDLNHGEAVSIGILCEMYYAGASKGYYFDIKNILNSFNLPTKLILPREINKTLLKKKIYKNLFLDKKKIGIYPRFIFINRKDKLPKIRELSNLNKIDEVLHKFII